MLKELNIKNMILIDELRLQFGEGLNVLTGETGTGKSIIVDCMELLVGERISSDVVRNKDKKCLVEGVIEVASTSPSAEILKEKGLWDDDDDLLIIRREITHAGRTVNRVNGRTVTASTLRSLTEYLFDIHLQNDNQQILNPRFHLHFLDSLSPMIRELTPRLAKAYREWKGMTSDIEQMQATMGKRLEDLEFIVHRIGEIETAALVENEDEELVAERNRIHNREKVLQALAEIDEMVFREHNSVLFLLARSREVLRKIEDESFSELSSVLEETYYLLEDVGLKMAGLRDEQDYDPVRLDLIEDRLQLINNIKRKYGGTITGALEYLEELRDQKSSLNLLECRTQDLEKHIEELWAEYEELAQKVSRLRHEAARQLEDRIYEELSQLSMPDVTFEIEINPATPTASGTDEVVFLFSANPGEATRPISKIASGGESSRFILALKTALADAYQVPVLIFDEIDVGVGGQALLAMGEKLCQLSEKHQIILVTHSPQIACLAKNHLQLHKDYSSGFTRIVAQTLDFEQRVDELSRMLAGDNADITARKHARQLLRTASISR